MNFENHIIPTSEFKLTSIPGVANNLNSEQRGLLDGLWDHLCNTGESFPKRRLRQVLKTRSIGDVMEGMAPRLMFEQFESGEKRYSLTMWGALSSSKGDEVVALYVHLLDLVKTLHEEDDGVSQIDSDLIREKLLISESESSQLGAFARIINLPEMPIYFAGQTADRSRWFLGIKEDVVNLFDVASSKEYFFQRLLTSWQPTAPGNTLTSLLPSQPLALWWNENDPLCSVPNRATYEFIATVRLDALRSANHVEFDCTRLICLCEELNACAAGGHAHAVILLVRAVLDHIPPVFGVRSFAEVASNYGGGGQSFKASAERLQNQARKVADRMLHQIIRNREVAPEMHEVDFSRELETVLAEVCRILKPIRTSKTERPTS
jgi:hypothetical protein